MVARINADGGVIIAAKVCQVAEHSTSLYRFDSDCGHIVIGGLRVTAGRMENVKRTYPAMSQSEGWL